MNPRIKSLGSGFVRIQDSRILIFKDSFRAIVLRIREDLLDLWKQVKSFENWLDLLSRYEPNLLKSGFVIHNTNQIFLTPDLWPSNRYKSMDTQNESMFLQISYTIPASLVETKHRLRINLDLSWLSRPPSLIPDYLNKLLVPLQDRHWKEPKTTLGKWWGFYAFI